MTATPPPSLTLPLPRASSTRCQPRHVTFTRPQRSPCSATLSSSHFAENLSSVLTAVLDAAKTRGQILQAAHALRKRAPAVRAESNLTEHVAPQGAGESCGCASACDWLWRPRDAIAPQPSPYPYPQKHPKKLFNTSRQVHATGRVGKDGARGNQGACAYLPGPTGAGRRAAPLTGPGVLALLDHPASHWLPALVTCSARACP